MVWAQRIGKRIRKEYDLEQVPAVQEKTAEAVDAEIRSWMDAAHNDAVKILTRNRKTVERLAGELLRRETLTGDEIREIISDKKSAKKAGSGKSPRGKAK